MNLRIWKDENNNETQCLVTIKDCELVQASLDQIDRKLLKECEISSKVSDGLLALEMLTRKIEKANENSES